MNTSSIRLACGALCALFVLHFASASAAESDPAAIHMATTGELPVKDAGPYVHLGSYKIWVTSHLGRPSLILPDGTLIYRDRAVEDSQAAGTLVVSFTNGRVSHMALVGHATELALIAKAKQGLASK